MSEPYEKRQAMLHLRADDLAIALSDVSNLFRNTLKYEGFMRKDYLTEEEYAVVEKLQEKFNEIMKDDELNNLVFDNY
jgi:hypothetical protein